VRTISVTALVFSLLLLSVYAKSDDKKLKEEVKATL